MPGAYAEAGVDYSHLQPFKDKIKAMAARTQDFPARRGVVARASAHCGRYRYTGTHDHEFGATIEGLGNKNWVAEWMYKHAGTSRTYYEGIGIDMLMMATNDLIADGFMPVCYLDLVVVGNDSWFLDERRADDFIESLYQGLEMTGMALIAGETPAYKYLVRSMDPVESAPTLDGCAIGILAPLGRGVNNENVAVGDTIIAVRSSGMHANGASLVFQRGLELPDKFLTELPNGNSLGDEILIPTMNYLPLVEPILDAHIEVHGFLPATGDGVAKLAFDKHERTYRVFDWWSYEQIPELFRFMHEQCGVSLEDCLKTFNWGTGYYIFVHPDDVSFTLQVIEKAGFEAMVVGRVEEGPRQTVFEPAGITLLPPGE